ncbi:MAG: hypothetical protein ACI9D0_001351 [Bacteroidia bacterium]|jgi:hypothetical protein
MIPRGLPVAGGKRSIRPSMEDANLIMWGMLFGSIGMGMFIYGKRERAMVPLVCGIALSTLPYVITSVVGLVAAGGVLALVPVFVKTP